MKKNIKISVITPTIRPQSLEVMRDCLKQQTFKEFEWLVDINVTDEHDLNASFNRMVKQAKGELLVFYEDYTKIMPDALERFWKAYQEHPNVLFTAPLGKVSEWGQKPVWDWRSYKQNEQQTDYTDCDWRAWEIDWGACPKKIIYEIGGFDEELDKHWSSDNVNVAFRAKLMGYKFLTLFTNPAIAYDHDAHMPHPFRDKFKPSFNTERMEAFEKGLKIDYLSDK